MADQGPHSDESQMKHANPKQPESPPADEARAMEEAQKDAAEERESERGYQ